jgi:hypothetical protein
MSRVNYSHAYPLSGNQITYDGVTAHNTLVLFLATAAGADPVATISSTLNSGKWYKQTTYGNTNSQGAISCWVCFDSSAGKETITFTNPGSDPGATLVEISGLDNAQTTIDAGPSGATNTFSTTIAPSAVGYIIGCWVNGASNTLNSPTYWGTGFSGIEKDDGHYDACEDYWDAPSGSQTVAFSGSGSDTHNTIYFIALKKAATLTTGSTCWGHDTGVTEINIRDFAGNWTGPGSITGSGDSEQMSIGTGEEMVSETVNTGAVTVRLLQNQYAGGGDTIILYYRTGASQSACESASWTLYSAPFSSLGYVQVKASNT